MVEQVLAIAIAASCPAPELINSSKEPWTENAINVILTAKKTCARNYGGCLKKLIKREPNVFWAICNKSD